MGVENPFWKKISKLVFMKNPKSNKIFHKLKHVKRQTLKIKAEKKANFFENGFLNFNNHNGKRKNSHQSDRRYEKV